MKGDRERGSVCKKAVPGWSLVSEFLYFSPRGPRELVFCYVIVLSDDTGELEKLKNRSMEMTAMIPRSSQRSETNMKPSFFINYLALYLAPGTTQSVADFTVQNFEMRRTKESDNKGDSINPLQVL